MEGRGVGTSISGKRRVFQVTHTHTHTHCIWSMREPIIFKQLDKVYLGWKVEFKIVVRVERGGKDERRGDASGEMKMGKNESGGKWG